MSISVNSRKNSETGLVEIRVPIKATHTSCAVLLNTSENGEDGDTFIHIDRDQIPGLIRRLQSLDTFPFPFPEAEPAKDPPRRRGFWNWLFGIDVLPVSYPARMVEE